MKTVVCGLGKCGSRMIMDLNAMLFNGEFSYKLRANDKKYTDLLHLFKKLWTRSSEISNFIREDEKPDMFLGDPDNQYEVVSMLCADSGDTREEKIREKLKKNIIQFPNYHQACGQYHIIGEKVMADLIDRYGGIRHSVIEPHIKKNSESNASAFFLCFSAGGGTGCGTSTTLAEVIAREAREQYTNLLIAGIAALPAANESENYKVLAGRFLTKFISSPQATSCDTVFTV